MGANDNSVSVSILDKSYQVRCPSEEVEALQNAAQHVDQEMRKIRDSGKIVGLDRIAIIAALNITYTLLNTEKREDKYVEAMSERIREMQKRIMETLTQKDQMEL